MKSRVQQPSKTKAPVAQGRRGLPGGAILVAGLAVAAGLGLWAWKNQHPDGGVSAEVSAAAQGSHAPVAAASVPSGFQKLTGRWLRPDGGYILEIKSVDEPSGKMEAAYLNPKSIHVAKAEATREGAGVKVFVELRDVNYPGSTYTLAHDPAKDQLTGIYYQAALQQQFEVVFERMP